MKHCHLTLAILTCKYYNALEIIHNRCNKFENSTLTSNSRTSLKDLLTEETVAAASFCVFFYCNRKKLGFVASGLHYLTYTSPPSHPSQRALGVSEVNTPSFCSYLV